MDCDDDANKSFCGGMGVQGFPTLKIVRPSKKPGGKPVVEDYQGGRTASAMVDAVVGKINNHVAKVTDKELDGFLAAEGPKAVLFTDKGTTSALLRSIAIDYLGVISVGQIRNKEKAAVEKFSIDKFPTLLLVPGVDQEPVVYDGELNKKDMVAFLKQVGEPNPDPAPAKAKKDKKSSSSSATKEKATAEPEEAAEPSTPQATPESTAPVIIPIQPISAQNLAAACLQPKSHTCVLALVPSETSEKGELAVASLSQLNTKYIHGKRHTFPFYFVLTSVEDISSLKATLKLSDDAEIIAVNARRGWWRRYEGSDFGLDSVESWLDTMRMGEGAKMELPKELIATVAEQTETSSTESSTEATEATGPEPEIETEPPEAEETIAHEEL